MTAIRQQRLAALLMEELGIIIAGEMDDPLLRLSLPEVTHVRVSRDLRHARVYVFHRADEISPSELIRRLQRAAPFLRSKVAMRCTTHSVPDLLFHYDDSPDRAARIDELLSQIAAERGSVEHGLGDETETDSSSSQRP
jgi:ribosome-binding factor A